MYLHTEGHDLFIVYISCPCNSWDADKRRHNLRPKVIVPPKFWTNLQILQWKEIAQKLGKRINKNH